MSRLNDLLRQLEAKDPSLAKELRTEYDALADRRAFGLNFERHTPESVELPGRKVRKGDKVHVLPERGKNPTAENSTLWRVTSIDRAGETATIEPLEAAGRFPDTEMKLNALADFAERYSGAFHRIEMVSQFGNVRRSIPLHEKIARDGVRERGRPGMEYYESDFVLTYGS